MGEQIADMAQPAHQLCMQRHPPSASLSQPSFCRETAAWLERADTGAAT